MSIQKLSTPTSSSIKEISYNDVRKQLFVTFKNNNTYIYKNVPLAEWSKFTAAKSKGSYFVKVIRNKYDGETYED